MITIIDYQLFHDKDRLIVSAYLIFRYITVSFTVCKSLGSGVS
jgi:hypothetical protein